MNKTSFVIASTLFAAVFVRGEAVPSIDVNGNYTFTVDGTDTYSGVIGGTDITVTKRGVGKLTLTGANTFTGTLLVKEGTVVAAPSATGGSPALVVESGATFDSAGGGEAWSGTALKLASITIEGHGVDGQGAFIRSSGTACRSNGAPIMKLTGDATVNFKINHNPGKVNLNGYTLTKIGAGNWDAYNTASGFVPDADGRYGGIKVVEGKLQVQQARFSTGSANNILELAGGSYINYGFSSGTECKWKLKVTADSTIGTGGNSVYWLRWSGPVEIVDGSLAVENGNAGSTVQFLNSVDATVNGIYMTDKGILEFRGRLSQTGNGRALWPRRGLTRIVGSGTDVILNGKIGYENDKYDGGGGNSTGRLEVVNVGYLSHPNTTYLSGSQEIPQTLFITNSVWDGGSSTIVVGNNYSVGVLDMRNSVVTNTIRVGGQSANTYAGSRGAVYQEGGEFNSPGSMQLGAAFGQSHGFFLNEGGRANLGEGNSEVSLGVYGYGAAYFIGGITTSKKIVLARNYRPDKDSSSAGVYWQTGGATNNLYSLCLGEGTSTNGLAIAAIEGVGTRCTIGDGHLFYAAHCPFTGILAVNDGAAVRTFKLKRYSDNPRAEGEAWHISVDGGALESTWQGKQWGEGDALPDSVTVHSGGMTLRTDFTDGGLYWGVPLDSPNGKIVSSIALPTDASFEAQQGLYFAPPLVKISGTGKGAAAIALFDKDTRRVTGIRVVAPGTGYDDSTTATIRPANGNTDPAAAFSCPVTMADAPTTGVGFTKTGAGEYFMQCANTYKGPTTVAEGTLSFYNAQSLPGGSGLKVCAGAKADLRGNTFTVPTLEGAGTIVGTTGGPLTVTNAVSLAMQTNAVLTIDRGLTLADGVTVTLSGTVADLDKDHSNVLLSAAGGIVCEGSVVFPALPNPWRAYIRNGDIVVSRVIGTMLIFR